jgi:hypothetical protein
MNLLSKREAEVVRCLAEGLTNREIADRLGLSQHTIKNHLFRIFDKLGVSQPNRTPVYNAQPGDCRTSTPAGFAGDPADGYDEATLALCQKAAEYGVVAAQLALARISWTGRPNDSDIVRAYIWFCVAIDQLTRTKNAVKRAMDPAQLAEGERGVHKRLNKPRIEPSLSARTSSSDYERGIVA